MSRRCPGCGGVIPNAWIFQRRGVLAGKARHGRLGHEGEDDRPGCEWGKLPRAGIPSWSQA